jgi:paired amphipathic helix protein Sin3a
VKAFTEADRYAELRKLIHSFLLNEMDSSDFEDKVRSMYWTNGYVIFTIDKLVQAIAKQLQAIVMDSKSLDLIQIYKRDREKATTSSRQEALYRIGAESIIQDDNIYRLEFVKHN